MKGSNKSPTTREIVQMQALAEVGCNPNRIGRTLGWDRKTVAKYLRQELSPEEKRELDLLMDRIKETSFET